MPLRYWFYREFKLYAAKQGIKLLRDDLKFIERTICNLPEYIQREACRKYIESWRIGMESIAPKNQNSGRYNANQNLRSYVKSSACSSR